MLARLFGSKTRVKILKLFLLKPEDKFYLRQIARELKTQINSVRRELENLENLGILAAADGASGPGRREAGKQDKKYFQANRDFVLHEELRALIIKAQILYEKDFVKKLADAGQAKLLVFTGRFVNASASAVDMLVVGRFNKPRFYRLIKELENELGGEINFTLMGTGEFKYRRDITDVFLYNILEGKKIVAVDELGIC